MVTHGTRIHLLPEVKHADMRLGRHQALDARSMEYTIENAKHKHKRPKNITPRDWSIGIPILDQGQLGSCTGNAGTYHLSALAAAGGNLTNVTKLSLGGVALNQDAVNNEKFAVALYSAATKDDSVPGDYPPTDTGSTGLAVCKALTAVGLVSQYTWATTMQGMAELLQLGGVIMGMEWYEAFFSPDATGFIDADANWKSSGVAGGHELYVEALETWDEANPGNSVVRFSNSWNTSWGVKGYGLVHLSTLFGLDTFDVKQFTLAPFPAQTASASPSGDDWLSWRATKDQQVADFTHVTRLLDQGKYSEAAAWINALEGGNDPNINPQPDYSPKA